MRTVFRIRVLVLACAMILWPLMGAWAQAAATSPLDELFELSGTTKLVGEIPGLVAMGMQMAQQEKPVDPKILADLQKLAGEVYAPGLFMNALREQIEKKLDQEKIAKLIEWYKGDLARRVTKAEEENSKPEKVMEMQAFIGALGEKPLPEARMALLKRLDTAIKGSEINQGMLLKTRMAMTRSLNALLPANTQKNEEALKEVETKAAEEVKQIVEQQLMGAWGFSYRDISDKDFEEYISFYEKDLGKDWGISLGEGLSIGMEAAGNDLAKRVAELIKTNPPVTPAK